MFLDAHEHEANDKKAEEVDFFADCENELNDFAQNNNAVNERQVVEPKVGVFKNVFVCVNARDCRAL